MSKHETNSQSFVGSEYPYKRIIRIVSHLTAEDFQSALSYAYNFTHAFTTEGANSFLEYISSSLSTLDVSVCDQKNSKIHMLFTALSLIFTAYKPSSSIFESINLETIEDDCIRILLNFGFRTNDGAYAFDGELRKLEQQISKTPFPHREVIVSFDFTEPPPYKGEWSILFFKDN